MAFSRFNNVSPFKNVDAHIAKREQWFSELPIASTSILESSNGITATDSYAIARGHAQGSLVFLPYSRPGKQAQKAATFQASGRNITDFDASFLEPLLAYASDDGRIAVSSLPSEEELDPSSSLSLPAISAFAAPAQKAVEIVQFHPTSSGLLLTNQGSEVQVWNFANGGDAKAIYSVKGSPKGQWSVSWSHDGRLIQTAGKDNTLNLWDVRQSTDQPVSNAAGHQGFNKPSRITSVNDLIFTTGFSKTRDRECALWDPRNFAKPVKKQVIDTNTGVLMPLVDHTRKMIYFVGRSDMSMRWAEITNDTSFTIGTAPLPVPSQGAALLPETPNTLDVMQAQIHKLVILSQDSVVPVTMQVQRRSYLDFHGELFPPVQEYQNPAQNAEAWQNGNDAPPVLVTPQPGKVWAGATVKRDVKKQEGSPSAIERAKTQTAASVAATLDKERAAAGQDTKSAPSGHANSDQQRYSEAQSVPSRQMSEVQLAEAKPPLSTSAAPSTTTTQASTATHASSSIAARKSPEAARTTSGAMAATSGAAKERPSVQNAKPNAAAHWSRAYLAGKTHLKPEYEDVHSISNTTSGTVQLLKANTKYFFYPLAGPGGRLAYHPIESKGRLPVQLPCIGSGHDIVDFVLDPFDEKRVFVAGSDGKVRVFQVPDGSAADEQMQPAVVLEDSMDKLVELAHHPNLADVLLSASEDHGQHALRVWDVTKGSVLSKISVPGKGLHSVAWDHLGTRVAAACKDKKLRILDPRKSSADDMIVGNSHDSMRSVKVVWVNENHLITCGFSRSAFREILLHKISEDGKSLEIVAKANIDVSPAPLFPHYDEDTHILFAYSKGERTCHAFEVTNISSTSTQDSKDASSKPTLNKIPRFEHGTLQLSFAFLPKQTVDVKTVDIAHAYRMTSNSVMHVRFSIPRAKLDYFQDDVYNGGVTRETMKPDTSISTEDWMNGENPQDRYIDIRPEGMPLLSEAPPPAPRAKQQIMAKQLSEEESQQAYLDSLFKHKQAEVDSDEHDQRVKERDAADDDDDW